MADVPFRRFFSRLVAKSLEALRDSAGNGTLALYGAGTGGVQVGRDATAATLKGINLATVTQDIGTIAADGTLAVTFTVTGVAPGDAVVAIPPSNLEANVQVMQAFVSAADTVKVELENETAAAIDPANNTWKFLWFDLT